VLAFRTPAVGAIIIFTPIAIHDFMPPIIAHYFSLAFSLFKTSARFLPATAPSAPLPHFRSPTTRGTQFAHCHPAFIRS